MKHQSAGEQAIQSKIDVFQSQNNQSRDNQQRLPGNWITHPFDADMKLFRRNRRELEFDDSIYAPYFVKLKGQPEWHKEVYKQQLRREAHQSRRCDPLDQSEDQRSGENGANLMQINFQIQNLIL